MSFVKTFEEINRLMPMRPSFFMFTLKKRNTFLYMSVFHRGGLSLVKLLHIKENVHRKIRL